jgi:hypothetical protein
MCDACHAAEPPGATPRRGYCGLLGVKGHTQDIAPFQAWFTNQPLN